MLSVQHHYRNFKHFYREMVCRYWRDAFPGEGLLLSFSGMDAECLNASVRLSQALLRPLYGHQFHFPELLKGLLGKVFADRGYVSGKLAQQLLEDYGTLVFCQAQAQHEVEARGGLLRLCNRLVEEQVNEA